MSDKYEFIAAERATHSSENSGDAPTIARMCAWIGVSKSGYYEWLDRRPSAAARRRELLADKIRALFEAFGGTYGYRRIHAELLRAGEHVGAELVRRLMRELGLVPVQPRPFRITTVPDPDAPETVDLLRRDFCADRPGIKVIGDITYIRTWQGWLYLATLIDCFNREVIGWSMADHCADRIGHRRAGHGGAKSSARTGLYYAFRPRYAIHVCRISGDPDSAWVAAFGRADRSMLG